MRRGEKWYGTPLVSGFEKIGTRVRDGYEDSDKIAWPPPRTIYAEGKSREDGNRNDRIAPNSFAKCWSCESPKALVGRRNVMETIFLLSYCDTKVYDNQADTQIRSSELKSSTA